MTNIKTVTAYVPATKGGRCWNGAHRDAGQIVHLVPPINGHGAWFSTALCGAEPGRRSYGWSESNKEVNCEKCKKKLIKHNT